MTEIFICGRDQMTQPSKVALRKAGVVVVEVTNPSTAKFMRSSEVVSSDDMLWAALHALSGGKYSEAQRQREQFTRNMLKIVEGNRATTKEQEQEHHE